MSNEEIKQLFECLRMLRRNGLNWKDIEWFSYTSKFKHKMELFIQGKKYDGELS